MPLPRKFVLCEQCGSSKGWPSSRKCSRCIHAPGRNYKYPAWTPERDAIIREAYALGTDKPRLVAALTRATARLSVPRYVVRARAGRLGLTLDTRRPWTAEERAIVERYAGSKSLKSIVALLPGRTLDGLRSFMGAWGLRWRVESGYSMGDIVHILGVSFLTVQKWRDQGLLVIKDGRVTEGSLRALVHKHPELYSLRRVDEVWFKSTIFPNAECYRPGCFVGPKAVQAEGSASKRGAA